MPAAKPPDAPFRPNLYVVARFLDALARPDEPAPTRSALQAAVGVNYDVFRRYLDLLARKRYVTVHEGPRGQDSVKLTAEGRRVRGELISWLAVFLETLPGSEEPLPARDARGEGSPSPAP